MSVFYTNQARKDLKALDSVIARRIIKKVHEYTQGDAPLQYATPLKGALDGLYRFRVGDYRVVFQIDDGVVSVYTILTIAHRKDVYR